jgi:hypothetical protein
MTRVTRLFAILSMSASIILSMGCDNEEDHQDEQLISEVLVIGTEVATDFLQTHEFTVRATPLDVENSAILRPDLGVDVRITCQDGVEASVAIGEVVEPSGRPLAIVLHIDQSSSMAESDPSRLRVEGAKAFIDKLEELGINYQAAIFAYGRYHGLGNFTSCDMLIGFTSNADSLRAACERAGQYTGTPTYTSLGEVLEYMEENVSSAQYERAIVLLSDGQPGDSWYRDEVCDAAVALEIPIYSIGLGPASDANSTNSATTEMRAIAECSRGAYVGIRDLNSQAIEDIYNAIASAISLGYVDIRVELGGSGVSNLDCNDIVCGSVEIRSGGRSAEGEFSFSVPCN